MSAMAMTSWLSPRPLFAARLAERTTTPVVVLEQAADPWVMYPDPREAARARAGLRRQLAQRAAPDRPRAALDRARPGDLGSQLGRADRHLPRDRRARAQLRAASGIQLGGHRAQRPLGGHAPLWLHLKPRLRRARVWSAGAERRGAGIWPSASATPSWCTAPGMQLREWIDRLLADPAERRRRSELGRSIVLEGHTFAHRVDRLLSIVEQHLSQPRAGVLVCAPRSEHRCASGSVTATGALTRAAATARCPQRSRAV